MPEAPLFEFSSHKNQTRTSAGCPGLFYFWSSLLIHIFPTDIRKILDLNYIESADHLIKMYSKRGYKIVATTCWNETNYQSVIMSKDLK